MSANANATFDPAVQARLRLAAVARSWIGTPFRAHASIKGAGVDCVRLAGCIYVESGLLEVFNPPAYTMDGGSHLARSQVLDWLDASPTFAPVPAQEPLQVGDLLCFRLPLVHHVGIVASDRTFIHAIRCKRGVIESQLEDATWKKRLAGAYRPTSLGGQP